jgi:hypothetical protein
MRQYVQCCHVPEEWAREIRIIAIDGPYSEADGVEGARGTFRVHQGNDGFGFIIRYGCCVHLRCEERRGIEIGERRPLQVDGRRRERPNALE